MQNEIKAFQIVDKGTALAHLDSLSNHAIIIWTNGFVCSFLTLKALVFMPIAHFVAVKSLFSI